MSSAFFRHTTAASFCKGVRGNLRCLVLAIHRSTIVATAQSISCFSSDEADSVTMLHVILRLKSA